MPGMRKLNAGHRVAQTVEQVPVHACKRPSHVRRYQQPWCCAVAGEQR